MLGTKTPTEVVAALAIVVGDSPNFFLSLSLPFTSCCLFAGCVPCDTNALCTAHRPPLFLQFQCSWLRQFAFHWGCCCKNWCNVLSNVKHSLLSQCFYTHTNWWRRSSRLLTRGGLRKTPPLPPKVVVNITFAVTNWYKKWREHKLKRLPIWLQLKTSSRQQQQLPSHTKLSFTLHSLTMYI